MLQHRFREHLTQQAFRPAVAAFVACPLAAFAPAHAAYVAEVYRVAREQAEARLAKPARPRVPAFSLN
jgi:hypothetical protein